MGNERTSPVFEAEAIEHVAVWAAEEGDTALESWCDDALAGNASEHDLLSWAAEDSSDRLQDHVERGVNLGWKTRDRVTS